MSALSRVGKSPVRQDREGRLAGWLLYTVCVTEQNQAFLMEVFTFCTVVWPILTVPAGVFIVSLSAESCKIKHASKLEKKQTLFGTLGVVWFDPCGINNSC